MQKPIIEACVETLNEAITAAQRGANQLELCSDLAQDGLTPALALTKRTLAAVDIPIKVMIRPRGGDFVFTLEELRQMWDSIMEFQKVGIQHFVIGMATPENKLDIAAISALCTAFPEEEFTLHKVIDYVTDPLASIPALNQITNLTSILTSGGAPTALEGAEQIMAMQSLLHPSKHIIAAGKITKGNLAQVQSKIPVPAYHGRRIVGDL
ncbi:copper homeostasis protein CutC [Lewinella cohaerens]|uniref:copper homeostasis protein CutC n=1 Tax=Lewinella cohaerens TaxID=70995 RepID=UPI00037F4B4A|nr:copper homeostasis protein CutC [Lewinella cohaerens]